MLAAGWLHADMTALARAVERGQLTLRHSVQPRILAQSPLIPVADGCDSSKGTTLTAESAEELCGETSSGSGVGPLRVAFDPVAARSSGSRGSGGGRMEAPATGVLSDIVPDQHPPAEEYDKVLLGTGVTPDCRALPLLRDLLDDSETTVATVGGFPVLSTDLQWGHLPIFVLGELAALQLGPGAPNLMGARHGADIVATKLGVNADAKTGKVGGVYTNIFSALAGESTEEEESTESDDSSSETEEEDEIVEGR